MISREQYKLGGEPAITIEDVAVGPYVKPMLIVHRPGLPPRRFVLSEITEAGLAKPWHVDPEKWSG